MTRRSHSRRPSHDLQQGSIVVLVLLLIAVLVVLVFESMQQMQVEAVSSKIFTAQVQGRALNRSGLLFAGYLLAADTAEDQEEAAPSDHYGEFWAQFMDQDTVPVPEFSTGDLNGTIQDKQGKFPLNFLVDEKGNYEPAYRDVLVRLLENPPFALQSETINTMLHSLKDWLDADDLPEGELGAEKDYYSFQEKGYECRNGPLATLGELSLIRGFDEGLVQGGEDRPGLQEFVTVHSSGTININTAPEILLAALVKPGATRETALDFARNMLVYRQDPDHFDFLQEKDWYRNRMAGFNDIQLPAGLIGTRSDFFSTLVTAQVGGVSIKAYAVHKRTSAAEVVTTHFEIQ